MPVTTGRQAAEATMQGWCKAAKLGHIIESVSIIIANEVAEQRMVVLAELVHKKQNSKQWLANPEKRLQ